MKKVVLLIPLALLVVLTGCSATDERGVFERWMEKQVISTSGITSDEAYLQYLAWKEEGKLDETSHYNDLGEYGAEFAAVGTLSEQTENSQMEQKQVRISFASNKYLTIDYFYDENREKPIDITNCHLDCGESIYASQPRCNNPYTNAYIFAGYRIYEYDSEGNRGNEPIYTAGNVDKVFTVPEDFAGTELSVEPIGEYQKREVSFKAYKIDKDGNQIAIFGGNWEVDGKEYTEDVAQLNPSDTYTVKYYFDSDEYYVVDTYPDPFSQTNGEVEFYSSTAMDKNNSYEVQLHQYLTVLLEGDVKYIESVKVGNNDYIDDSHKVTKLKVDDIVSIVTKEGYRLFCSQFPLEEPEKLDDNKYRYHFSVPEINEEICIRVSKTAFTVNIASNVGNDISFDIEAAGFQQSNLVYEKEILNGKHEIVNDAIGAEETISISARGDALPESRMLRLDIKKTDNNKNESNEIAYISSVPGSQVIGVYENGFAANVSKVYKKIEIMISLVEVVQYREETVDHGTIELFYSGVNSDRKLQDGEYIEDSTKVKVVLRPDDGYYVSGKKMSDDDIKFKDYDFVDIVKEHPIKKLIVVTLDTSDEYGTCIFKIDGKEVSGEVELRGDQKLTLEYTLTDPNYQIVRESEGFFDGIKSWGANTFSKNKESIEIDITQELDGTVITRDSYIKVDEK